MNPLWQYKICEKLSEQEMNELGAEGWEMISSRDSMPLFNKDVSKGVTTMYSFGCVFKRIDPVYIAWQNQQPAGKLIPPYQIT